MEYKRIAGKNPDHTRAVTAKNAPSDAIIQHLRTRHFYLFLRAASLDRQNAESV
jgi:hypothetical protein